jgi:DNA primase
MNSDRIFISDEIKDKLKAETDILALLYSLGVSEIKATRTEGQYKTKCIFSGCKTAKKSDYPLSINTDKKVCHCHHCGKGGDIFKIIMNFKNIDFYEAKLFLYKWNRELISNCIDEKKNNKRVEKKNKSEGFKKNKNFGKYKAFGRRLNNLKVNNIPILKEKGIRPETLEFFGAGYCSYGFMKNRVVVPVYDSRKFGEDDKNILVYAGYSITKEQKEYGDWKFPDGFPKGNELFNLNRAIENKEKIKDEGLILVEGFWSVLKLHQAGIENTVAVMTNSMTKEQESLLLNVTDKISVWFDFDKEGQEGLKNILRSPEHEGKNGLMYKAYIKVINPVLKLDMGGKTKPYQFSEEEIKKILKTYLC